MLFILFLIYQAYSLCVSPYIIHDEFFQNCDSISYVNENTKFQCANLTMIIANIDDDFFEGTGIEYDECNKNTTMIELKFENNVVDFNYKNYHFLRVGSTIEVFIDGPNINHVCVKTKGKYFVLAIRDEIDLYVNGVKKCSINASQLTSGNIEFGIGTHLDFLTVWDYEFEDVMIHDIMRIRQHETERNFEYCFEIVPKCYDIGALELETCSTNGRCSSLNNCTCCPGYFGNECEHFNESLVCTSCPTCNTTKCQESEECPSCNSTDCPEPEECPTCPEPEECPTYNGTESSIKEFDITKYDLNKNLIGVLTWIIIGYLIVTFSLGFLITWIVIGYKKLNL